MQLSMERSATQQDSIELRDELTEVMRDMQTEVLSAFHAWARPLEIRLRAIPQIDERLALIEARVRDIEFSRLSRRRTPGS
jgi:hypothetical protein